MFAVIYFLLRPMPQEVCLSCWYLWKPRSKNPRECPKCHSRKTTSLRSVTDAVEAVNEWLKTDPLIECLFNGEVDLKKLADRLESRKNRPLDVLIAPFRAAKSISAFQKVVNNAPLSPKKRLDVRRVILEIAGKYKEEAEEKRIGDFVEEYIENMSRGENTEESS